MTWIKDEEYENLFYKTKEFNGFKYYLGITVDNTYKSTKFFVQLSSGKKRKELEIFEEKENKSGGGFQALLWAKEEMLNFCYFFKEKYYMKEKAYLCVSWADNRRKKIYARTLLREGFYYGVIEGSEHLIKRIKL